MPGTDLSLKVMAWYDQTIAGSNLWSGIGFVAATLVALILLWIAARWIAGIAATASQTLSGRRRRHEQGYSLGVAPFGGSKGRALTRALIAALQQDMKHFSFGATCEIIKAPAPKASGKLGFRDSARKWLSRASADLIVWGHRERGSAAPLIVDILSCEGSLAPAQARQTRVHLPADFAKAAEPVRQAGAYLIARALQPGLARATAFRPEKLGPVADILAAALASPGSLPEDTLALLETDYCAMALHIASGQHLQQVASLRRSRLSGEALADPEAQIAARIDLGRALLGISAQAFDPARVREAMDHLKAAVELLKQNPTIQLANQTSNAVQQGQAMLSARQRFSVTGGSI